MAKYDFDLLTIGAGSGGVAGSRRAGTYGAKVAIIEASRVGGTCVLRGCIPKKLLVYGAHFHEEFIDAAGFGWTIGDNQLDWAALVAAKDRELDRLNGIYVAMLEKAGVEIIGGRGVLTGPHSVRIGERSVTAERILIATGGWPTVPNGVIEDIRAAIGPAEMREISDDLNPGDEVQIIGKLFQGLNVVVTQVMPGRKRVAVLLHFLGRQTTVEIGTHALIKRVIRH